MASLWPALSPLASLLLALLLEKLLPEPAMGIWRSWGRLAMALQLKVNPWNRASAGQQRRAGLLALLIMLLPLLLITFALPRLLQPAWLVDALLLWLAFAWTPIRRDGRRIADALDNDDKQSARELLQPWLLRNTAALSSIGIAKACIEMLLLRALRNRLLVLLWFVLLGPLAALAARACAELARIWNCKCQHSRHFGRPASRLLRLLEAPALWLTILLLKMRHPQPITIEEAHGPIGHHTGQLLRHAASSLQLRLGGPVLYEGEKQRRPRYSSGREPDSDSIRATLSLLRRHQQLWLLLITAAYLGWALVAR